MQFVKFVGLMEKIRQNYNKDTEVTEFIRNELNISKEKAKLITERVQKLYDFNYNSELETYLNKVIVPEQKKDKKSDKFDIYSLDSLSGKEFEDFLKWLFQELGYKVQLTKVTADSGVDLVLEKDKKKIAVQAKRYNRNSKISNNVVLKTYGGMGVYNCEKSIIITTTFFTAQAKKDAEKLKIELWDRDYLSTMIDEINLSIQDNRPKIEFPEFSSSLLKSLLNLKKMGIFEISNNDNSKYDLYRHGINNTPLLSFRVSFNNITHISFRIKNKTPLPEYGPKAWAIRTSDRGNIYGPDDEDAYEQIIKYLSQYI